MIITYKLKHDFDIANELNKAKQVALYAIKNRNKLSSKEVSHIGLKSAISNQILRKYGKNKKCKYIKRVNLIIPGQALKIISKKLRIIPLKLELNIKSLPLFKKVKQVELSKDFAFISVEINEALAFQPTHYVGLDRNVTKHVAVVADPISGKVLKLGKECLHLRNKYRNLRAKAQKSHSYRLAIKLGKREANIIKDINHKISKKIIQYCVDNKVGLALEDLKGIRKQKSKGKKLNGMVHSWSFYQLESFLTYKALLSGVTIVKVNPAYTSQKCSRCNYIGDRDGKNFRCINSECKHIDHADVNAAFNIGKSYGQSEIDRDILESLYIFPDYEGEITTDKAQLGNVKCVS